MDKTRCSTTSEQDTQPSVARFTPGPWCYENIGEKENLYAVGVAWRLDDDSFRQIGGQVSSYDENGKEQLHREAICFLENHSTDGSIHDDARLIAAAPELYEALVRLLRCCETSFTGWPATLGEVEVRNLVRTALSKAVPQTVAGGPGERSNTESSPNQTVATPSHPAEAGERRGDD